MLAWRCAPAVPNGIPWSDVLWAGISWSGGTGRVTDWIGVALAALTAGLVNALAGGGSLISFPALTALGLPPLVANVTNTVALLPGYLGATLGQRSDLAGQGHRLRRLLPAAALGGLVGALLLLRTSATLFDGLVPWLILLGSGLLAIQAPLRTWLLRRAQAQGRSPSEGWALLPVFLAAIYGGYFGAGLSVIVLAALALTLDNSLPRLNGLKQALAFGTNLSAAGWFLGSGQVAWGTAAVMAVAALLGGALGGRLAGRVNAGLLRALVVLFGVAIAVVFFLR